MHEIKNLNILPFIKNSFVIINEIKIQTKDHRKNHSVILFQIDLVQ